MACYGEIAGECRALGAGCFNKTIIAANIDEGWTHLSLVHHVFFCVCARVIIEGTVHFFSLWKDGKVHIRAVACVRVCPCE